MISLTMYDMLTDPAVRKGIFQLIPAALLAVAVVGFSYMQKLDLEWELSLSLIRALVQVLFIGSVIGVLLTSKTPYGPAILLVMILIAAWISRKRAQKIPSGYWISLIGIGLGSGTVILLMCVSGTIEYRIRNLIPVGSMIIASAMKTNSLALDRLQEEITSNRNQIEAILALGVSSRHVTGRYLTKSVRASLIPIVESMKSLGVVFIPGMMSGMILSGANPLYAAEYQFIIMAMLFSANGLTGVTSTYLARKQLFTDAEQLQLKSS